LGVKDGVIYLCLKVKEHSDMDDIRNYISFVIQPQLWTSTIEKEVKLFNQQCSYISAFSDSF